MMRAVLFLTSAALINAADYTIGGGGSGDGSGSVGEKGASSERMCVFMGD